MTDLNVYQVVVVLSVSFMSAFSIALNNYAKDVINKKQTIPLLYISECMISGLSGFFLSLISILYEQNLIINIIAAGIGGFAGRKLLFVLFKVLLLTSVLQKNVDIDDVSDDINRVIDDGS